MIRAATLDDIPPMVEMGERFFRCTPYAEVTTFDAASFADSLTRYIGNPAWTVHCMERSGVLAGMAAGVVYPFYFNHGHVTGQEMFWWVDPEFRGEGLRLHETLETRAQAMGAKSFVMGAVPGLRDAALDRLYRQRGYRRSDNMYLRGF